MTIKATIKVKGFEFSMDKQCPKCKNYRPVHMFLTKAGETRETCEVCRTVKK